MEIALKPLGIGWGILAAVMAALWLRQRRTRDAGTVDVAWAGGLGGLAVLCAVLGDGDPTRRLLLGAIGGSWGFRLCFYLWRRLESGQEDGRYQTLRQEWGDRAQRYFFLFFQAQALLAVVLALPFAAVAQREGPLVGWDWMALAVWGISIGGETLADSQLARFRKDPSNRGKTCRAGLWRLSRHPNYFFEWVQWWSYVFLALPTSTVWLTLISPVLMLFLILKVTGIPPTEAQALLSRGEDYRRYQRTTNAFFPWFPRTRIP